MFQRFAQNSERLVERRGARKIGLQGKPANRQRAAAIVNTPKWRSRLNPRSSGAVVPHGEPVHAQASRATRRITAPAAIQSRPPRRRAPAPTRNAALFLAKV